MPWSLANSWSDRARPVASSSNHVRPRAIAFISAGPHRDLSFCCASPVESRSALSAGRGIDPASAVQRTITTDDLYNLRRFAAYQYLRIPGAVDRKSFELDTSPIPDAAKDHALNPGRFVETGCRYVENRFQSLKVQIFLSLDTEFITSDWPCFDFKDSSQAPLLGEEIGTNPSVVCYMPLTPVLGAVFIPSHFSENVARAPTVMVSVQKNSIVRNQNTLVIQQADRYVIASREEDFVFKIAAKRRKNGLT
jgi:hypothetical protein